MTDSQLGTDLGYLFEVGFNIGLLTYIKQKQIKNNYGDIYAEDLSQVNLPKIVRRLVTKENAISHQHRETIKTWVEFFLQKSFLAGLNFLEEYLTAIGWNKPHKLKRLEIVYYQCCFSGNNSIGTYPKEDKEVYRDWWRQFKNLDLDTSS